MSEKETDTFHNTTRFRPQMNSKIDKNGREVSKPNPTRKRRSRSKTLRIPNELVLGIVLAASSVGFQLILSVLGVSAVVRLGGI
jgi:hypothetical protein